ncbi:MULTISPECIES: 30S ribosomal protein S4 [Akkermansia]|uniref:30S ribosomal protein S4 n=1 Tax=Akkermansia TaxID=239934 RepID=UPI001BFFB098|nr:MULTISPECIES: 30S ribosomal protein S4 [Akkermansia]MBT8777498.1 30S ribosomal protein S4 [Akkermansia muciniphila]
MARYTGPRDKVSRRFGVALFGSTKALEKRPFPPGQHGMRAGRKKKSDYGVMLAEKQKLRFQYGVLEGQFRKYYAEAARRRGITGDILLQLLELRLDNVVYRLGFSNTRAGARQLVSHGHITVNGKKTNVASYSCRPGDVIAVGGKASSQQLATRSLDLTQATVVPDWLECDRDKLTGKVARVPSKEEIAPIVNEQLIVEFYSR